MGLAPLVVSAQSSVAFTNLAASAQGDLYFNSSLSLSTEARPQNAGNAFHYAVGRGLNWFAPDWGSVRGMVDVSADGRVFANTDIQVQVGCGHSTCPFPFRIIGRIVGPGVQYSTAGYAQVSRNGRYALLSQKLVDLTTGAAQSIDGTVAALRQAVSDDGAVLLAGKSEIILHRANGDTRYPVPCYNSGKIDGLGTRIVYSCTTASATAPTRWALRSIDVMTGRDTLLAEADVSPLPPLPLNSRLGTCRFSGSWIQPSA